MGKKGFVLGLSLSWVGAAGALQGQPKSLVLKEDWSKHVRFLVNRGDGAVRLLDEMLQFLDPERLEKLPGFPGWSKLRLTLMTFEFRSREVLARITQILERGGSVRLVRDPATYTLFQAATADELGRWSEEQKTYYQKQYDLDHDGEVSERDVAAINENLFLAYRLNQELEKLAQRFPRQLDLISPPYEKVPATAGLAYPRMTHFKKYAVEFAKGPHFEEQEAIFISANLTDSCLDKRISQSRVNVERYLNGEAYTYAKGSEGNIQFGAWIKGASVLRALKGPTEGWIELFRQGRHFDELKDPSLYQPRVTFYQDEKLQPTALQAAFSEGTRITERSSVDPVTVINRILLQPENKLKVYYDAQFVFSHHAEARALRGKLAHSELEEFGVFVDGNFAAQPYSALPELLFAPRLDNQEGVLSGRAIDDGPSLPPALDWQNHVFEFDGEKGVFGARGDKLHSKLTYLEYVDGENVRHHLVVWGSANKSTKAGRMNADGLLFFDSPDPQVGSQMRAYFQALKKEARLRPFAKAWLERRLLELLKPDPALLSDGRLEELSRALSLGLSPAAQKRWLKRWQGVGALHPAGERFLGLVAWFAEHSERKLNWTELSVLLSLVRNPVEEALLLDLGERWIKPGRANAAALAELRQILAQESTPRRRPARLSAAYERIRNQCERFLTRIRPELRNPSTQASGEQP